MTPSRHRLLDVIEEPFDEMDSLELIAFIGRVEQNFDVKIPNAVVAKFRNYDDVADFVFKRNADDSHISA
jgi:acyl carrier protein